MGSRNVVHMLAKTLVLGGILGLITSFFISPTIYAGNLSPFDFMELLGLVLFYIGFGMLAAVVSETGFFAYLFVHRFGLSLFRSFWPTVQVLVIVFVLFDLIYFPYQAYHGEVSIFWFMLMTLVLLAIAWLVAKQKAKETNRSAFVPALFLLIVITTLEWVPALQAEGIDYAILMIVPLLACNIYQLFCLHRMVKKETKGVKAGETGETTASSSEKQAMSQSEKG